MSQGHQAVCSCAGTRVTVTASFAKASGNAGKQHVERPAQSNRIFVSAAHQFQQPYQSYHKQLTTSEARHKMSLSCNPSFWLLNAAHSANSNGNLVTALCKTRIQNGSTTRLQMCPRATVQSASVRFRQTHNKAQPRAVGTYSAEVVCRSGFNRSAIARCAKLRLDTLGAVCRVV